MGDTTNKLIKFAHKVNQKPDLRELDMLVSTGERISMSLLSMALHQQGCAAVSLTGSQAGVLTTEEHSQAKIIDIKSERLIGALNKNKIVILAGFQGVSKFAKEVTTLGRGGSDTSTIAITHFMKNKECEIIKDVGGIFNSDPKKNPLSVALKNITYKKLRHMTFWGARILHYRSILLASKLNINISVKNEQGQTLTIIKKDEAMGYEDCDEICLSILNGVIKLNLNMAMTPNNFLKYFKKYNIPECPIMSWEINESSICIYFSSQENYRNQIEEIIHQMPGYQSHHLISTLSFTFMSQERSSLAWNFINALKLKKIFPKKTIFDENGFNVFINSENENLATKIAYNLINKTSN